MSRASNCHPERPYYGKGKCRKCYNIEHNKKPHVKAWHKRYNKKYHTDRKEKIGKIGIRNQTLKFRYGITQEKFEEMLAFQKGICLLCDRPAKVVDHNHKTGKIRGLLCYGCNASLNRFEIKGWVRKAQKYLKEKDKK